MLTGIQIIKTFTCDKDDDELDNLYSMMLKN